jgi:type IV secretion system protein VirB10
MADTTRAGANAEQGVREAAAVERERRQAELKAARESGLMVKSVTPAMEATADGSAVRAPPARAESPDSVEETRDDPRARQRKFDFAVARERHGGMSAQSLTPPASPYTLSAGSVIAASLITGLRSDVPGLVTAQVTERVYDSATGTVLLIPQGARLIGTYDSAVAFGQRRALVVWQRIILPNGSSMTIDDLPATDAAGYAGLADEVDLHTWTLLKGAAVSTLLGVGANLTFAGESDLVQAVRQSTQQSVSRAGDQLTSRNLQIQPTISVRPGAPVRLVVHRDLNLLPWIE